MQTLEGIWRRDGVFLRRDAVSFGVTDGALRRAVRSGELVRIRQGAYTFAEAWQDSSPEERHRIKAAAVMRAACCSCVLSHTTAALALGVDIWDMDLESVHITRQDRKGGRREAGIVQHRGALGSGDVSLTGRWPTTSAVRTALDVTTITDVEHALVIVSSVLHRALATKDQLQECSRGMVNVPGSLTTDLVLRLADGRLDGPGEARAYYAFWIEGLPAPELQWPVADEAGHLVGLLDFAWPEARVWVEFDGRQKYLRPYRAGDNAADVVVREKTREDEIRRLTGWVCVRIVWADLQHPERIAAKVRHAMAAQAAYVR
jgi:hypothetical protein